MDTLVLDRRTKITYLVDLYRLVQDVPLCAVRLFALRRDRKSRKDILAVYIVGT